MTNTDAKPTSRTPTPGLPTTEATPGVYRFALYGRSGSGKTCMLGAMAAGAIGHPGGMTCELLPPNVPPPGPRADSLLKLERWLRDAEQALNKGDVPRPNPPEFDDPQPYADFEIGARGRGKFRVRTIDYSGELINTADEAAPDSLASLLKQRLKEFDGFLVVAAAPRSGAAEGLHEELTRLKEAFASLSDRAERMQIPVAVVITKWDRVSDVNYTEPKQERTTQCVSRRARRASIAGRLDTQRPGGTGRFGSGACRIRTHRIRELLRLSVNRVREIDRTRRPGASRSGRTPAVRSPGSVCLAGRTSRRNRRRPHRQ